MFQASIKQQWWIALAAALALVAGCAECPRQCAPECPAPPQSPSQVKRIKLLFTTDIHGYVEKDAENGRIGYAALAAYAAKQRAAGYDVMLLDGGDLFSGNSLTLCDHGQSIAALAGAMGYSALAPGNHAFDFDVVEHSVRYYPETILPLIIENTPAGLPPPRAVAVNMKLGGAAPPNMENEPVILYDGRDDGNNLRLVVAGMATPYIAEGSASPLDGYDFGLATDGGGRPDDAATRRRALDALARAVRRFDRPDDVVVVLSHIGWSNGPPYADGRLSGKDMAGVANVDIVLDGHTHEAIPFERIGDAVYANGGAFLETILEIDIAAASGATTLDHRLLRFDDFSGIPGDPAMAQRIRAIADKHGFDTVLFRVPESAGDAFSGADLLDKAAPLGRLICRAQAEAVGARIAFMNSGGIRAGFSAGQEVTVADIYNALPFPNRLFTYEMTEEELLATLRDMPPPGKRGFLQQYGIDAPGEGGRMGGGTGYSDAKSTAGEKRYLVAINSFLAAGGDGFVARGRKVADHGPTVRLVVEALKQAGDMDWEGIIEPAPAAEPAPSDETGADLDWAA